MRRREDKTDKTYFRSERLFCLNGQWYFSTREGEHGPFASKDIAARTLKRFVNDKVELDGFQRSRVPADKTGKPTLAQRLSLAQTARSRPHDTSELVF
jgi:Domain of unknown function (DUF6316)